jgi:hypothetical protein
LKLGFNHFSKNSTNDKDFIFGECILNTLIHIMKEYEKLKLYFKIEVIVDFLYEILNEK